MPERDSFEKKYLCTLEIFVKYFSSLFLTILMILGQYNTVVMGVI